MSNGLSSLAPATLLAGLLFSSSVVGVSADPPPRNAKSPAPAPAKAQKKKLSDQGRGGGVRWHLESHYSANRNGSTPAGSSSNTIPPGFVALDVPKTLTCPRTPTTTCRVVVQQVAQLKSDVSDRGGASEGYNANRWALCTKVNGVFLSLPACPFLGKVPYGYFVTGSASQHEIVPPGEHTVQTFIYTDNGATIGIYSIDYHMFQ